MVTIDTQEDPILAYYHARKPKPVPTATIIKKFSDGTALGRARIYERIRRYERNGAIHRVKKGLYYYKHGHQSGHGDTKYEVMWRLLRARRKVTVADLQELAGVSNVHASMFLATMVRHGVCKKTATGTFLMINDTVEMPRNDEAAARKRAARERVKQQLGEIRSLLDEINKEVDKI